MTTKKTTKRKFPLKKPIDDKEPLKLADGVDFGDNTVIFGEGWKTNSIVDIDRQLMLYQLAKLTKNIIGDVAEVGVYKGGTAKLLAETFLEDKKILHLYDTFNGMPPTEDFDLHFEGNFNDVTFEEVQKYLWEYNYKTKFYVGIFPETFNLQSQLLYCFVHVDCDIYTSVRSCCEIFYPRMSKGGIILFDDYGLLSCPGAKIAVDEYCRRYKVAMVYLPTGQCFFQR